ncbi:hypothetical protein [Bdellovibrio sp. HCB274]|uniref:hypothetical protein n=1 Tax=Bdellovibrio sp. HCB274 TaxID=3394361 RepID=UPI0039B6DA09
MAEIEIHEIIDRETKAWNEKSIELLLSIFHHEMVWVWPTDSKNHDPISWTSMLGKFDQTRWTNFYKDWFSDFQLIRNVRKTQKIFVTKEGDGAFAVVDIDTLWRSSSGEESHWIGRTCKTYVKTSDGWKMIAQTGVLDYSK